MKIIVLALVGAIAILSGQTRTLAIKTSPENTAPAEAQRDETSAKSKTAISVPTLGFLQEPAGAGLIPIRGIAAAASLGEVIPLPEGVGRFYLPPRQHYALVEENSSQLAIWHLARAHLLNGKDLLDVIAGALAHPDSVAFSPKGMGAALYFGTSERLQTIGGLPGRAAIKANISTASLGQLTMFALSDDGDVVIAKDASGQFRLSSHGDAWRLLPWSYQPLAWSFVPNTHDLVISDSQQKALLLIPRVDETGQTASTLAPDFLADHVAVSSDGEILIAESVAQGKLWSIDVKTAQATAITLQQRPQLLLTLRDGHTFLLSQTPSLTLLKLQNANEQPIVLTHPGISAAYANQ